jgi:hypothetical protein
MNPIKTDRCEVCNRVIAERPVRNRRRCADHLDQLVLVPARQLAKPRGGRAAR